MDYSGKTVRELQLIAKKKGLRGYSKLKKAQLITLLKSKNPYESMTVVQLKQEAKKLGISGYSTLNKPALVKLLKTKTVTKKPVKKTSRKAVRKPSRKATKKPSRKAAKKTSRSRKAAIKKSSPKSKKYQSMTVVQLKQSARERGLSGYSKLNKAALLDLLNKETTKKVSKKTTSKKSIKKAATVNIKDCAGEIDYVTLEPWTDEPPTVYIRFHLPDGSTRIECYNGESLGTWFSQDTNVMTNWVPWKPKSTINDMGKGGKPGYLRYHRTFTGEYLKKTPQYFKQLITGVTKPTLFDAYYAGKKRLGSLVYAKNLWRIEKYNTLINPCAGLLINTLHGQAPGENIYVIKSKTLLS